MKIKKIFFSILIYFSFPTAYIFCQELTEIESQLDSLLAVKSNFEKSLDSINYKIKELEILKIKIQTKNDTTNGILVALAYDGYLMDKPYPFGNILKNLPKNTKVLVMGYSSSYKYFKAKFNDEIGYIHEMFYPKDKALDRVAIYGRATEQTIIESKKEAEQTTTKSQKTSSSSAVSKSSSSSDKTIHTGPRGGKYYINSKGKKVYIDKKKKK
jgi:hypothetical protein